MQRSTHDNTASHKPQLKAATQASILGELYWLICVVEAGSFSAAAERTGIAKSSLSRRIIQLEKRLQVQLLNRSTRSFSMTTLGERIYRHALDMLSAAEAAEATAQEASGTPSGLLQLCAPAIFSGWLLERLGHFQASHPKVSFALINRDGQTELSAQRLDLSLSLDDAPSNSSDIVARPLARLQSVIVGNPALLKRLGHPQHLGSVDDQHLLAFGAPQALRPWLLADGQRPLHNSAFSSPSLQTLLNAARAGIGLACLPLHACHADLQRGSLLASCPQERPASSTLYALTPAHRGITPAVRGLIQHIRHDLSHARHPGMQPVAD
ncbi:LysR family transcriptional regulator [Phytopseudomonas dryadis]|uniref:LysR family transcriptional regulator n=1 Tax=Phytopseudomonas dryadis TaxID=2487520 RepID=A0A4Q9QUF5_9GAMM|nr:MULTISPECIES: LysR family transcriptional regulator [Pseudomonas]TBU86809.1 LysR family transcriptional regulator [Pseudomonas dryadis]TBV01209.1 LysR family transcriptional regulator [Pseudomonas dryadis]TBV14753.1 LysR family transcriptional regulator [Pseudomonas sp. FRB 230]